MKKVYLTDRVSSTSSHPFGSMLKIKCDFLQSREQKQTKGLFLSSTSYVQRSLIIPQDRTWYNPANLTVNHVVLLFPHLTSPRGSQVYYWEAPWAEPLWKREPLTSALPSALELLFLDHQWDPRNEQNGRLGTQSQPPKNQSALRSCVHWTMSRVT